MGKLRRLQIEVICTDDKTVAHGWAYYEGQDPAKMDLGQERMPALIGPSAERHDEKKLKLLLEEFAYRSVDHVKED